MKIVTLIKKNSRWNLLRNKKNEEENETKT